MSSYVTLENAIHLVKELKILYGRKFLDQWHGVSDTELALKFAEILSDIQLCQYEYALNKMIDMPFVPTIPQFRSWCLEFKLPEQCWLSSRDAWAKCLNHAEDRAAETTEYAMKAFLEVKHIFKIEGQISAYYAFKDIYDRLITNAKINGEFEKKYETKKRRRVLIKNHTTEFPLESEKVRKMLHKLGQSLRVKPKSFKNNLDAQI